MASVAFHDRVKMEGVSVSGTSSLDPSGGTAPDGFLSIGGTFGFPDISASDGALYPLAIVNTSDLTEWEIGLYRWDNGSQVFTRNTTPSIVLASSNSGSWVSFTAGSDKDVFLVSPAEVNTLCAAASTGQFIDAVKPISISFSGTFAAPDDVAVRSEVGNVGAAQTERYVMEVSTTDDTETEAATILLPASASIAHVHYRVVARVTSGSSPFAAKALTGEFVVTYDGSSRTLVGTPVQTVTGEDAGLSSAAVAINQSASVTQINVTGLASTSIAWAFAVDVLYSE